MTEPVPEHPAPTASADSAARDALRALRAEVGKAVVGQDAAVTGLVIALLCRGHVLLEGVPGRREDAAGAHPRGRRCRWTPSGCSSPPT